MAPPQPHQPIDGHTLAPVKNPFVSPSGLADERSLLPKLVGTFPVLVAFPSILLSGSMAYVLVSSTPSIAYTATVVLLVMLASSFLLMIKVLIRFNLIALNKPSSTGAENTFTSTAVLLLGVALVFFASEVLPISRLAVVFLGLYLNEYNLYTLITLVIDIYVAYNESQNHWSAVGVILGHILVVISFKILFKKLVLSSISNTLGSLNTRFLGAIAGVSFIVLLLLKGLSLSIVGVNLAASIVFVISLHDADLTISKAVPVLLAVISISLEYIVLAKKIDLITVINMLLPLLIVADRSREIEGESSYGTAVEVSEKTVSSTSILRELMSHSDTKAILNFLLLNTTFMFIQLLYSFRSKSLGLLSDSLHMALDCTSLALGLVAGILSKNEINVNGKFPFGLRNFEILAGFTNGTLLIGISGSIIFEAIQRLFNPIVLQKTNELIIVSIMGLLVNLVGIFAFNHGHGEHGGHTHGHSHSHDSHSHSHVESHSHSHEHSHSHGGEDNHMNDNMKGIFLHILADTLGSVGVVISALLTKFFGWEGFDPVASIIIAALIFFSAIPLIKSTASTLLLKLTTDKESKIRSVLSEITHIKGLKSYTTPRFWPNSTNSLNGYIHIQIYRGENSSYIKKQCEQIFQGEKIEVMIQMENDYDDCWCRKDSDIMVNS
ncbi:cation efflux protein [Suhomyces tanzawaensis NRRL Y-17324]|uniref:Zinc transporter n=1 Tax=Suhomyces tanzawaensis NRRL Y-17324 TaxID=984487 RepID=A0A1E4SLX8_9ASCO|nr:cation efflux protein [Suhomyces tanzawaensis NRRL Y-17324]ODV80521.1 cation efflux protein [Suhomyces tanzawaensis NRRL Y-17324]